MGSQREQRDLRYRPGLAAAAGEELQPKSLKYGRANFGQDSVASAGRHGAAASSIACQGLGSTSSHDVVVHDPPSRQQHALQSHSPSPEAEQTESGGRGRKTGNERGHRLYNSRKLCSPESRRTRRPPALRKIQIDHLAIQSSPHLLAPSSILEAFLASPFRQLCPGHSVSGLDGGATSKTEVEQS
ncbi:hypothetical protein PYCCODRAFT_660580 [Trametes coccinea BRFM310]|uniref:Uncharacterized protein n=1 Tax=Trametes coccinea (strain BRFM310) TaxID=1353009 RepID=A0A1Y2IJE9_TRAC3|nr:hypothetical protein PYCCODRAFT_660580 [Trametes coccinea BRFM310]